MKYSKIVKALDMMFYLIGKQRNSYWETQETAAYNGTLWNQGNQKIHLSKMACICVYAYMYTRVYVYVPVYFDISIYLSIYLSVYLSIYISSNFIYYFC